MFKIIQTGTLKSTVTLLCYYVVLLSFRLQKQVCLLLQSRTSRLVALVVKQLDVGDVTNLVSEHVFDLLPLHLERNVRDEDPALGRGSPVSTTAAAATSFVT